MTELEGCTADETPSEAKYGQCGNMDSLSLLKKSWAHAVIIVLPERGDLH